jgi:hypothetical protein
MTLFMMRSSSSSPSANNGEIDGDSVALDDADCFEVFEVFEGDFFGRVFGECLVFNRRCGSCEADLTALFSFLDEVKLPCFLSKSCSILS